MTNDILGNTGFRKSEKSKDKELSDWIKKGDEGSPESTAEKEAKEEKIKTKLLLEIPTSMHSEFKALCKKNGFTMREELRKMIEKYIRSNKNKK